MFQIFEQVSLEWMVGIACMILDDYAEVIMFVSAGLALVLVADD